MKFVMGVVMVLGLSGVTYAQAPTTDEMLANAREAVRAASVILGKTEEYKAYMAAVTLQKQLEAKAVKEQVKAGAPDANKEK